MTAAEGRSALGGVACRFAERAAALFGGYVMHAVKYLYVVGLLVVLAAHVGAGGVALANEPIACPSCAQGEHGGQCVTFVREIMGGDRGLMPGLCMFHRDCGAYWAWEKWDLGHGRGKTPRPYSIMVLDRGRPTPLGHCAVVLGVACEPSGMAALNVMESNWHGDERIDCGVTYRLDMARGIAFRAGDPRPLRVLGFIYGQ